MQSDSLQFVFTGDVLAGQDVTVAYTVKVKAANNLGNSLLKNMVIGAFSNCHPDINGQTITVADPNCKTEHPIHVDTAQPLAPTGQNMVLVILLASGLAGAAFVLKHRAPHH